MNRILQPPTRQGNPGDSSFGLRNLIWILVLVCLAFRFAAAAHAVDLLEEDAFPRPRDLRELTIEELLDVRITAVARRPEPLRTTPSAVSVITSEQIRNAGVTNLPDALRLATGVHVARSNNNTWAVGVRGFNATLGLTNKLLVLQDGRSLYSPLFAGTFWDIQDVLIEDIERIEVVRGPGATMWGANAVNGVINIVTRHARDTQGPLLSGGAGTRENGFGSARYGGRVNEHTWYRVYATGWDREDVVFADGTDSNERRRFAKGGFRVDSEPAPEINWTLQGEIYDGRFDRIPFDPIDVTGGHLLGRWTHSDEPGRHVSVQAYYDRVDREVPEQFGEERNTFDVEFQHRLPAGERHDLMWGGNFRVSQDRTSPTDILEFAPQRRTVRLFSGFVQDTIALGPELVELTLGSKFEHNTYTGFEYQPSARLAWMPHPRHTVWTAVSRATRTPSRLDANSQIFSGQPNAIQGNPDFASERLLAYEAGYRVRPILPLTLDLALFYHDYDRLRSLEGSEPAVFENRTQADLYGGEITLNYQVSEWWRLRSGYAHLQKRIHPGADSTETNPAREGNDPRHILFMHSGFDLGDQWHLAGVVRHVSSLPSPAVPGYTELDLRAAFLARNNLELSISGRNLLESHHREFGTSHAEPRSVFFRARWGL